MTENAGESAGVGSKGETGHIDVGDCTTGKSRAGAKADSPVIATTDTAGEFGSNPETTGE
jgi:hypothetical protein